VSETRLSLRACETELFIESCFAIAREWILECLLTLRSSFLLKTDRPVEAAPDKAAIAATGAPITIPTPVRDVATAPEDRAADHGIVNRFPDFFIFFQHKPVMLNLNRDFFFNFTYFS